MKACKTCGEVKDLDAFTVDGQRADGRSLKCRACASSARIAKSLANRSAGLCTCGKPVKPGSEVCKACWARYERCYTKHKSDPEWLAVSRVRNRDALRAMRNAAIDAYGATCACCGERANEFLTIDHIGGIKAHGVASTDFRRKATGLYAWLKQHNYPAGFRVLCMNCNWSIGCRGYCPHQTCTK